MSKIALTLAKDSDKLWIVGRLLIKSRGTNMLELDFDNLEDLLSVEDKEIVRGTI